MKYTYQEINYEIRCFSFYFSCFNEELNYLVNKKVGTWVIFYGVRGFTLFDWHYNMHESIKYLKVLYENRSMELAASFCISSQLQSLRNYLFVIKNIKEEIDGILSNSFNDRENLTSNDFFMVPSRYW